MNKHQSANLSSVSYEYKPKMITKLKSSQNTEVLYVFSTRYLSSIMKIVFFSMFTRLRFKCVQLNMTWWASILQCMLRATCNIKNLEDKMRCFFVFNEYSYLSINNLNVFVYKGEMVKSWVSWKRIILPNETVL